MRTPNRTVPAPATWAAIRVPRSVGLSAIGILGARSGPVLDQDGALHWFISPANVPTWDVPGTRPLDVVGYLALPPSCRVSGPGPHWRVSPGGGVWTTDAAALQAALEDAANARAM